MQSYRLPDQARPVPLRLERLIHLRPAHAWMLVLFFADLAVLGDAVFPGVWFGPIYLLVVLLATWCLGWGAGQLTGLGCVAATWSVHGGNLHAFGSTDLVINVAVRYVAVSVAGAVLAGSRQAYISEWWLARTDPLTGALNRQAFFELGAKLARYGRWRLMIYADLDGLKQLNDQLGHSVGDGALKAFASAVLTNIRYGDLFARVGGDEFLIFMAVKDQRSAELVAARLHKHMNSVADPHGKNTKCSVGALLIPPGQADVDDLVRAADNLMYRAKDRGACLEVGMAPDMSGKVLSGRARTRPRSLLPEGRSRLKVHLDRRSEFGA